MLLVLANIGTTTSLILGILAIFFPSKIANFVAIQPTGKEGNSEIRATYGGFFVGISTIVLLKQSAELFLLLGTGWLCAALVRFVMLFLGYYTHKNFAAVCFELCLALLILCGMVYK